MLLCFTTIGAMHEQHVDPYAKYWKVLEVRPAAPLKEIEKAYIYQFARFSLEHNDEKIMILHQAYQELYVEGKKLEKIGLEHCKRVSKASCIQAPEVKVFCGIKENKKVEYQDFENQETYQRSLMRRCLDPKLQLQLAIQDIVVGELTYKYFKDNVFYKDLKSHNESGDLQLLCGYAKLIQAWEVAQRTVQTTHNVTPSFQRVKEEINAIYQTNLDTMMLGREINLRGAFNPHDYGLFHAQLAEIAKRRSIEKYPDLYKKLLIATDRVVEVYNQLKQAEQDHA